MAVVGDLRRLVHRRTYAVPDIFPDNGVTMTLHIGLDRRGNIQQPMPFFCVPDSFEEALSRHINEILGFRCDGSAGECRCAIPVKSVNVRSHIHTDDIALLEDRGPGIPWMISH